MPRLFVAIDLPREIVASLREICYGLPGARWVDREQIHLTLRFIGEVDGGTFDDIREELSVVRATSFNMQVKGLGLFPPRGQPKVLWAGVKSEEPLRVLRRKIDQVLLGLGLAPEGRKFSPHITLARLNETPLARLGRYLAGNGLFATEVFSVAAFHLYSSRLKATGAVHTIEASYSLAQL